MNTTTQTALTPELITATWTAARHRDVQLSPDGGRVAWSAAPYGSPDEHPESGIWISTTADGASARRWTRGGSDTTPRWSPDGRQLALLSDRAERGTHGLWVLDTAGGEARPLVVQDRAVAGFCWAPSGGRIACWAPDPTDDEDQRREDERDDADVYGQRLPYARLHLVDVSTGDSRALLDGDVHVFDATWSPDGRRLVVAVADTPDYDDHERSRLLLVDVDDGATRQVWAGRRPASLAWMPHGRRVVFLASHDQAPQSALTTWTLAVDDDQPAVRLAPDRDETACAQAIRPVDRDTVAVQLAVGLGDRIDRVDVTTGARQTLVELPGDTLAFDVAMDGDGPPILATVMSDGQGPWEVWAGHPEDLQCVSDHHADWSDIAFGAVEDFTATADDGLELDAVLIQPASGGRAPHPTVVLVHGGPYARAGRQVHCHPLDWAQLLATAGCAVLLPNYRGGAGRGDDFAAAALGDMGGAEWGDIVALVDAAVDAGIADPDRLGIGGWSQGGFLTAWAVTQTDRFKVAVMGAGVSDWNAMAAHSDVPTFERALGGSTPWDGPGPHLAVERSPISYATNVTTPLLILHGQQDVRVPLAQATSFHRALQEGDSEVELVVYPREPHGIGEARHQQDLMHRVLEFHRQHLPLDQPDDTDN